MIFVVGYGIKFGNFLAIVTSYDGSKQKVLSWGRFGKKTTYIYELYDTFT